MKKEKEMLIPKGCLPVRRAGIPTRVVSVLLLFTVCIGQGLAQTIQNQDSPFGFHPAGIYKPGYTNNGYGDAQYIGIKWTRQGVYAYWFLAQPDLTKQEYDFSRYDKQWSEVPTGMKILANIAPQGPIDEGYCLPNSYMPIDKDKYIAFVKTTVERYDGDGLDDMSNLVNPIKYWQVGNEPHSIKKGFADLQRITYTAIKEVCPDCNVLIGGVPGMPPVANYINNFDLYYKPILDSLVGKHVDIMDFHWYGNASGDYRGAKAAYDHIRSVLNADGFPADLPIWITEMGAYSGDPVPVSISNPPIDYPAQTERQQAIDYFKRFVYSLSFGVKKIFPAFGLMEGFKFDGGYFDYTGLIYDGWDPTGETPHDLGLGTKKLGYYTYKIMTEMLEGSDWNKIQSVQESDAIFIYKFTKSGKPIWVAWNDSSTTRTITISGIASGKVKVTETVPKFSSGKEVVDYATAFRKDTLSVSNGTVVLTLGENPVFVEPLTITNIDEEENIPNSFVLYQNYPNPFNPTTTIRFQIADVGLWNDDQSAIENRKSKISLKVFDVLGREIATLVDDELQAGERSVVFSAAGLPSGVYFYRLKTGSFVEHKKMLLVR